MGVRAPPNGNTPPPLRGQAKRGEKKLKLNGSNFKKRFTVPYSIIHMNPLQKRILKNDLNSILQPPHLINR